MGKKDETDSNLQKKILIVDDDPEMRLAMHVRLKASNYAVSFAVDGISGVAAARLQSPDVILLDLGLPAGDGFTVLEHLANGNLASIPVIVVSGRDHTANCERSLKAGARIFLQKPVRNSELLLAIDSLLGVKPPPATPIIYDIGGGFRPGITRKSAA